MSEEPDVIVVSNKKPVLQSRTIIFLALAAVAQIGQQVALGYPGWAWAAEALGQLNLMLLGMAGVARAAANGPLK